MKTFIQLNPLVLISAFALLNFATGCKDSTSNPLEKYAGLKSAQPSDNKAVIQSILAPELFSVQIQGTNQINHGQFVEGQESELLIKVTPKSLAITKFSVQLADFPNVDRPVLAETSVKGIYSLRWLPNVGTIPGGKWGETFQAQLQITVLESSSKMLVGGASTKSLDIIVSRNSAQPKISGRSNLANGIDEGKSTVFTVDVIDPGSLSSPRLPEIQITPYISANTEAYRADGSRYLVLDDQHPNNPEKIAETIFRFYYLLQADQLPLDRDRLGREIPVAANVDLCFQMRAVSVVGTLSDQLQVCTKARYAAQAPVISFTEIPELKAGVPVALTVKISTLHPQSVISIPKPSLFIANIKGLKEVSCAFESFDKKNSQICIIKWTPECNTMTTSMTISVKADSTLGSVTKSATKDQVVSVVPNLANCPVPTSKGKK